MSAAIETAKWLARELRMPGRSQTALAKALALDPSAVNRMVLGKRAIKATEMVDIRVYLEETGDAAHAPALCDPVRKTDSLTVRLSPELRERADAARLAHHYKPTLTAMVERGLELAIAELNGHLATTKGPAE